MPGATIDFQVSCSQGFDITPSNGPSKIMQGLFAETIVMHESLKKSFFLEDVVVLQNSAKNALKALRDRTPRD